MIISTSSNVVSAAYIILIDVLLPVFLAYLVRIFLSSRNVKAIYKNRKTVELNSLSSIFLVHQGVSEKRIGTTVAILSTLIIALGVAGGFSIEGKSREPTVKMRAPVVIEAGSGEDVIDFTKHVSEDGMTASKTYFHARRVADCKASKGREVAIFAAMSEDAEDLNAVKYDSQREVTSHTCLVKEENFEDKEVVSFYRMSEDFLQYVGLICLFRVRTGPGILAKGFMDKNKECPLEFHDIWCAHYRANICVAELSWSQFTPSQEHGYSKMIVEFQLDLNDPSRGKAKYTLLDSYTREKAGSTSIRSLAYLSSLRVEGPLSLFAHVMTRLRIQTDTDIQRIKDQVEVTDVNLVFLASTLGPALVLLSVASVITYCTWRTNVAQPGLQKCNRLYSAHDLLLCAVREASQETSKGSEDGKSTEGRVVFGVSRKMPHVGPLWESDDEGSELYAETELEGTRHMSITNSGEEQETKGFQESVSTLKH